MLAATAIFLENMFNSAAKPFYNSAEQIYLDCIPKEVYTCFAEKQFSNASSVQYAIRALLEKQLLTYQDKERTKVYSVSDRFLEMWICRTY